MWTVYVIFYRSVSRCNLVGKLGIYRQKLRWGIFPENFWSPLAPKLLVQLKKSTGCKNGTDILYFLAKFGGDPPLRGGVRKKSWEILFLFVTLWILNLNTGLAHQRFSHSDKLSPFVGQF